MAASFIYKPGTYKGPVVLVPSEGSRTPPVITLPDGRTITGQYLNTNEGRHQFVFPRELYQYTDLQVSYGGQTGTIADGKISYEGNNISGWSARDKGSLGSSGGSGGGYDPTQVGQYGFAPANVEGLFPSPTFANFDSIETAPYKFTNPFDFAKKFGEFNRTELRKNYDQSKEFGLEALDTELKGLQGFAPAAAALQRREVSLDNTFNQEERTRQIEGTLPGVRGQLDAQGTRAETYAGGKLPSSIEDRAFEVASRSRAADLSSAGGFGAGSGAARKASELMSAEQRLNLSKYGDSLLTQNIGTKANLLLAPTEYANAGSQIRVMPTADAATRAAQLFGEINNQTMVSATNALGNVTQQRQFQTSLEQGTREFNASGEFNESQFNAGVSNEFALTKFGYQVGYAGAVAGAAQTSMNTGVAIDQQNAARETFEDSMSATQNSNNVGAITGLATAIGAFVADYLKNPGKGDTEGKPTATGTGIVDTGGNAPIVSGPGDITDIPSGDSSVGEGPSDVSVDTPVSEGDSNVDVGGGAGGGDTSSGGEGAGPTDLGNINDIGPDDSSTRALRFTEAAQISEEHIPQMKTFMKDVGEGLPPRIKAKTARQMAVSSDHALQAGGISRTPRPGYVQSGYGVNGKPVYSDRALMNNTSTEPGRRDVQTVAAVFKPFKNFTKEDQKNMERIGQLADPSFIGALDALAAARDPKAFARMLTKALKTVTTPA